MKCHIVFLALLISFAAFAQTQDVPPATTRVEKKSRTWTNEDLEKLSGPVNVIGSDAPAAETAKGVKKTRAQEKCASDAWVAAVTVVMKEQGVPYPPRYWSERLFGDACLSDIAVASVASRIDGDYTLDDGKKLHLATTVTSGLPAAAQIVASVDERRPLIVKWQNQPLIVTKVDYVDRQYNYVSQYSIAGLMLTNALNGRVLVFDLKTNSEKEIEGSLQVTVTKRK